MRCCGLFFRQEESFDARMFPTKNVLAKNYILQSVAATAAVPVNIFGITVTHLQQHVLFMQF